MDAARVKSLELTLVAIQFGLPVKDAQGLLEVADLFRAYIEPPKPTVNPADGDDYPRLPRLQQYDGGYASTQTPVRSKRDDAVNPADGEDYPRMQPSGYDAGYSTIPGRY